MSVGDSIEKFNKVEMSEFIFVDNSSGHRDQWGSFFLWLGKELDFGVLIWSSNVTGRWSEWIS